MELQTGQIVTSRQGRDVTRTYMVVAQEGERALLADGKKRPLAAPKRKNIRHINPTGSFVPEDARKDDTKLKAALKWYEDTRGPQLGG